MKSHFSLSSGPAWPTPGQPIDAIVEWALSSAIGLRATDLYVSEEVKLNRVTIIIRILRKRCGICRRQRPPRAFHRRRGPAPR